MRTRHAIGLGLIGLFAGSAHAQLNYGDFMGSTVSFFNVTEDAATDDLPLFGVPSVTNDTLDFDPTDFLAYAEAGSVDSTIGTLDLTIAGNDDNIVDVIQFRESGDYTLLGVGGIDTEVRVAAPVFISINEVDGVAINPVTFNANVVYTPAGDFNLADNGKGAGIIWEGALDIDVSDVLLDAGVTFVRGATEVDVILNNILGASSEAASSALLQKKEFQITVVPEPATAGLLGLMGLFLARRRSA